MFKHVNSIINVETFSVDENILFEFDGSFWHPKSEAECKYPFQKRSVMVDKLKNEMAAEKGIRIIRIREEEPVTTEQMKKLIFS